MIFGITDALKSLRFGAEWVLRNDSYDSLDWLDSTQSKPSEDEINAELARLQAEYDAQEYQRKRAAEYPDFKEYLDGIVKGDQAQIADYIAKCQAVKNKYPKGGE